MNENAMYHDGNRRLQDEFGSRPMADHLEAKRVRTSFNDADKQFIESAIYFFIATADAQGRPDCSYKGGAPGFVRVVEPDELAFPDYDGNGMFKSLGNLMVNPNVGLLFIACMRSHCACGSTARHRSRGRTRSCHPRSARS